MNIVEMFEVTEQAKGKKIPDKMTLIDAQLRFVREVNGSLEHVTWVIDVDPMTDFMQTHLLSRSFEFLLIYEMRKYSRFHISIIVLYVCNLLFKELIG